MNVPEESHVPPGSAEREVARDAVPLHGVDFSGARERRSGNRKLWIASWDQDGVRLERGTDRRLTRRGLADRIAVRGGVWVLDFPFGPARAVAAAMGWSSWSEYLAWAGQAAGATDLRNEVRQRLAAAGIDWSSTRAIDLRLGTTWFPFFEQLYRQTILGAREVLGALREHVDSCRILPFDEPWKERASRGALVVEGFPGWTLRALDLPSAGYKKPTEAARALRTAIVARLRAAGLPIPVEVEARAVGDRDGDALDALVLLWAASRVLARGWADWSADGIDRTLEGWFFD